jgi:hypothetical protein
LLEPVQGEGGVRPFPTASLKRLRELCDKHGLLLIFDEVQCGVGRTGKLYAHEWAGVSPDLMAIAKGIGGGFPVGACLATDNAAKGMTAGVHGTTFGGNPLAMAVGNAVLDVILEDGFMAEVSHKSLLMKQGLAAVADEFRCHRGCARLRPAARPQMQGAEHQDEHGAAPREDARCRRATMSRCCRRLWCRTRRSATRSGASARLQQRYMKRHGPRPCHEHPAFYRPVRRFQRRSALDLSDASARKADLKAATSRPLDGKVLAMIFENPRRARVSFDVGMRQLGGETIMLTASEMQLGKSETISDTAKVLSRYVDAIMIRTTARPPAGTDRGATVPVINGLTDDTHPCQLMADIMTFEEHRGR